MCIIFLACDANPEYRLILAANRDEYYKRPTKKASYWNDFPKILGGRDLEQSGTWMAIHKDGRFGAVTNYRDLSLVKADVVSRGYLIKDYLADDHNPKEYLDGVKSRRDNYNPFNLLVGDTSSLYYYSNIEDKIKRLSSGIYSISNHLLDTPWPKVTRGSKLLEEIVKNKKIEPEALFQILSDSTVPDDNQLPNTGIDLKWERVLSPIFIESEDYGTRSSTVLLIDKDNHVTFIERSLVDLKLRKWNEERYNFNINKA